MHGCARLHRLLPEAVRSAYNSVGATACNSDTAYRIVLKKLYRQLPSASAVRCNEVEDSESRTRRLLYSGLSVNRTAAASSKGWSDQQFRSPSAFACVLSFLNHAVRAWFSNLLFMQLNDHGSCAWPWTRSSSMLCCCVAVRRPPPPPHKRPSHKPHPRPQPQPRPTPRPVRPTPGPPPNTCADFRFPVAAATLAFSLAISASAAALAPSDTSLPAPSSLDATALATSRDAPARTCTASPFAVAASPLAVPTLPSPAGAAASSARWVALTLCCHVQPYH